MKITQIAELLNQVNSEILGEQAITIEDLSSIVEIGQNFELASAQLDNYVKTLVDHIGRVVFVDRAYSLNVPSVLIDGWDYGSILEKITVVMPDAVDNESWELINNQSYDPNIFYQPEVEVTYFNNKVTFSINMSFCEKQIYSAFSSLTQLNQFFSTIRTAIQNSMSTKLDALIMRTLNNFIADTFHADYGADLASSKSGIKAVNLLYLYNNGPNAAGTAITAAASQTDPEFIKFAVKTMNDYLDRMPKMSTLFNINGTEKFTPRDDLHLTLLSTFKNSANVYLQSDTFNEEYTALPNAETVPYWQGSGAAYSFADVSSVNVKSASGNTVSLTGVLACAWDRNALGVCCQDPRVKSHYVPNAEFVNEFYKYDAQYFNDYNENFVFFFVA